MEAQALWAGDGAVILYDSVQTTPNHVVAYFPAGRVAGVVREGTRRVEPPPRAPAPPPAIGVAHQAMPEPRRPGAVPANRRSFHSVPNPPSGFRLLVLGTPRATAETVDGGTILQR